MNQTAFYDEIRERLDDVSPVLLDAVAVKLEATLARSSKIIIAGNGGSAAIASHVAVDITKVLGIPTITLHDPALITCYANDYGFDQWMAKAIESYGEPSDCIILISSSGKSPDILHAAEYANDHDGMRLITLSGFAPNNPLRQMGHTNLWCNSTNYNVVESVHLLWLLAVVEKMRDD